MTRAGHRRAAAAVAVLLVAVLGVALGAVGAQHVASLQRSSDVRLHGAKTVATVTPSIFDRPQRATDQKVSALPGRLVGSSFRRIATIESGDTTLYAAQDIAGNLCLVSARDEVQAACATPAAFARVGIVMRWSLVVVTVNPTIDSGYRPTDMIAVWEPDGRVRATSTRG